MRIKVKALQKLPHRFWLTVFSWAVYGQDGVDYFVDFGKEGGYRIETDEDENPKVLREKISILRTIPQIHSRA